MTRPSAAGASVEPRDKLSLADSLQQFRFEDGPATIVDSVEVANGAGARVAVATFTNEFWTSKQRAGQQPARSLLSRLLQAAAPALLHRAADRARRHRLRPVHGPRHDAHRGGADGAGAVRLRRESAESRAVRTAARAAGVCGRRACARRGRFRGCRSDAEGTARLLSSRHAATDLSAAENTCSRASTRGR